MPNINLEVTFEIKLKFSELQFCRFKMFDSKSISKSSNSRRYHLTLKLFVATENYRSVSKNECDYSMILILKRIMTN